MHSGIHSNDGPLTTFWQTIKDIFGNVEVYFNYKRVVLTKNFTQNQHFVTNWLNDPYRDGYDNCLTYTT